MVLARDATDHTPFFYAFVNQALDTCRILLEHAGEKKDQILSEGNNEGELPIHRACGLEDVAFLQLLLDFGADVDTLQNGNGFTPTMFAVSWDMVEHLKLLIKCKADINIPDSSGWTPLHIASYFGRLEALEALVKGGASVTAVDKNSWTPLHYAAYKGHHRCVEYLLYRGADLKAQSNDKMTPLALSSRGSAGKHSKVVEILPQRDSSLNLLVNIAGKGGRTPLYLATVSGNYAIMKILIEAGANINIVDDNQQTLIAAAMTSPLNGQKVVQVLLDVGVFLDEQLPDPWGRTLLFYSAGAEAVEQTKLLLANGVDKDAVDEIGRTALDVCIDKDIRGILGAKDDSLDLRCPSLLRGRSNYNQWQCSCDVCLGGGSDGPVYIKDDFWYRAYSL